MEHANQSEVYGPLRIAPPAEDQVPVVVIGLPRSGTSFLSHALSQLPDYYVFDDLYLISQREAKEAGTSTLDDASLSALLGFLGWQIRARHKWGIYSIPAVPFERVEEMNTAMTEAFTQRRGTVLELQAEWLYRLARAAGKGQWGFKMPKALLYADALFKGYPNVQVICLMRQPEEVLASYKHMPRERGGDGDPRRYHPLVYAPYWRFAARRFRQLSETYPDRVHLVRFHEFVADPLKTTNEIASILGTAPAAQITRPERQNSSFKGDPKKSSKKTGLTGLEARLVRWMCAQDIQELGFERRSCPPVRLADFWDFFRVSAVATTFQIGQVFARMGKRFRSR